ncbi:hypothetical protein HU200_039713 [Digitaria exilis]|uniref:Uncharacterized protein n=1 Tax=Digitaria exilis TaxID=1010633 RepID=A0A835BAK4_9POAL|nr:hypothetical protein HU200_039713 [Digitaria exilis]
MLLLWVSVARKSLYR